MTAPPPSGFGVAIAITITAAAQTVRMSIPYACAALGGLWSERSGIVNIALEGILLASALASVVADAATGSAALGLAAGAAVGAFLSAIHAAVVVFGRVDAIVSGIALNLVAAGGTRVVLRALYTSSSNSPAIAGFTSFGRAGGGFALLIHTLIDPLTVLTVGLWVATWWTLYRTRFGLRVRACGEAPSAAASVGVDVAGIRMVAVTLGGAVAGVGGVALAYDQHRFDSAMSGGRGFIALAAVILSGWRPGRAVAACVAFAALDALQIVLQEETHGAAAYAQMLPYVATLGVLWVTGSRNAPEGLGKALP